MKMKKHIYCLYNSKFHILYKPQEILTKQTLNKLKLVYYLKKYHIKIVYY